MKKLNIWGYYGVNYGDDIMLQVLINELEGLNIDISIIQEYNNVNNKVDLKSSNIINIDEKLSLKNLKIARELALNSINIWGGGTIFTDCDGDGNFRNFFYVNLVGGSFAYVGIGIGKITKVGRKLKTNYLLSRCDFATFRDPFSIQYSKVQKNKDKFSLVNDLSYCYFDKYRKKHLKKTKDYLLITWRNLVGYYSKSEEESYMEEMIDLALNIYKKNNLSSIKLMAMDDNFDIECCKKIKDILDTKGVNSQIISDRSIDEITKIIDEAYFHLSGRLHGSIASEFLQTNYLSLSYSQKMDYFHKMINKENILKFGECKINSYNYKLRTCEEFYDFSNEINQSKENINIICKFVK